MDTYHGCSLSTPLSSATPARCSFTGVRGREFLRTSGVGVVESSPPKTKNDAGERRPPTIAYTEVGRPVSSLRGATSRGAWSEYHAACLARPLGLVARLVRRPEQLLGSLLGSDGDADARRGVHHMPLLAGFEGHAQPFLEAFGDLVCPARIRHVLQQDGELVPPPRYARLGLSLAKTPSSARPRRGAPCPPPGGPRSRSPA